MVECIHSSPGQQPYIISGVRKRYHHSLGVFGFIRIEHAGADTDSNFFAVGLLGAQILQAMLDLEIWLPHFHVGFGAQSTSSYAWLGFALQEVTAMCGRFVQYQGIYDYLEVLAPDRVVVSGYDNQPIGRYNVAPGACVSIIHCVDEGLRIDPVHWGWAPLWAKGKRADPINARVETVTTGKFFKQLWPKGRALVMADGWYEWVMDPDDPKKKQPYFIRLKTQAPMFFAALARVYTGQEPHEGDGFVIITAASDQGMVDIYDRRPVVFKHEQAREWMSSDLDQAYARGLLLECYQPTEDFEWFPVGKGVGNVKNQGPELIIPLAC